MCVDKKKTPNVQRRTPNIEEKRAAAFSDYSQSFRERAASQGGKRQGREREARDS